MQQNRAVGGGRGRLVAFGSGTEQNGFDVHHGTAGFFGAAKCESFVAGRLEVDAAERHGNVFVPSGGGVDGAGRQSVVDRDLDVGLAAAE